MQLRHWCHFSNPCLLQSCVLHFYLSRYFIVTVHLFSLCLCVEPSNTRWRVGWRNRVRSNFFVLLNKFVCFVSHRFLLSFLSAELEFSHTYILSYYVVFLLFSVLCRIKRFSRESLHTNSFRKIPDSWFASIHDFQRTFHQLCRAYLCDFPQNN